MNIVTVVQKTTDISADVLGKAKFAVVTEVGTFTAALKVGHVVVKGDSGYLLSLTDPSVEVSSYDLNGIRVKPLSTGDSFTVLVGIELATSDKEIVANFLHVGRKIDAIKHVRTVTKAGLKDAKEYTDNFDFKPHVTAITAEKDYVGAWADNDIPF